jgi:hypothetical protein
MKVFPATENPSVREQDASAGKTQRETALSERSSRPPVAAAAAHRRDSAQKLEYEVAPQSSADLSRAHRRRRSPARRWLWRRVAIDLQLRAA